MNKPVKYTLITLSSLLGVLAITIVVVCNFLFSKEQLTNVTKDFAQRYVNCETQIGDVELTFFSSFPNLSLCLNDVAIINPMPGAQSDTLLGVHRLYATLDVMAYVKENRVNVTGFSLVDAQANVFVNEDSLANYNVFNFEDSSDELQDTTSTELSLERIRLRDIAIEHLSATYLDMTTQMEGRCKGVNMTLNTGANLRKLRGRGKIDLEIDELFYSDSLNYGQLSGLELSGCRLLYTGDTASVKIPELKISSQEYLLSGEMALLAKIWGMRLEDVDAIWADNRPTFQGVTLLDSSEVTLGKEDVMYATTKEVKLDMPVTSTPERWTTQVDVMIKALCFAMDSEGTLADKLDLNTKMTASTSSAFNDFIVSDMNCSAGSQAVTGDIHVDMTDTTLMKADVDVILKATSIDEILALVPAKYKESLKGMTLHGNLSDAHVIANLEVAETMNLKNVSVQSQLSKFHYNDDTNLSCDINAVDAKVSYPAGSRGKEFQIESNLQTMGIAMADDTTDIHVAIPSGNAKILLQDDVIDGKDPRLSLEFDLADLKVEMDDTLKVELKAPKGKADVDMASVKNCIKVGAKGALDGFGLEMGKDIKGKTGAVNLDLTCLYDERQKDVLDMVSPVADFRLKDANFQIAGLPCDLEIPAITATFNKDKANLTDCQLKLDENKMTIKGAVSNINDWLKGKALLEGNLMLKSPLLNIDKLMDLTSGIGCEEEAPATAEATDASENATVDHSQGDPFMVPKDVKFVVTTDVASIQTNGNSFDNVKGQLTVDNGILVLEEMGFTSKAAKMQLTALYKSPRRNNLFAGWNFHLLDIDIAEMIKLVPEIDTIVPMLSSFAGKAEFHLAGETALFADYTPKMSTLKAVAAIEGKDLTVLDNETFKTIKKYLFKESTTNKIDTMSVELAVARKKMTLYPMLIGWDKYEAVISGNHTIVDAMPFNYHISITKCPLVGGHLGLDITGNLEDVDNISFKLGNCKYANLYRPEKRNITQGQTLELKNLISTSLKRTVKEQ